VGGAISPLHPVSYGYAFSLYLHDIPGQEVGSAAVVGEVDVADVRGVVLGAIVVVVVVVGVLVVVVVFGVVVLVVVGGGDDVVVVVVVGFVVVVVVGFVLEAVAVVLGVVVTFTLDGIGPRLFGLVVDTCVGGARTPLVLQRLNESVKKYIIAIFMN